MDRLLERRRDRDLKRPEICGRNITWQLHTACGLLKDRLRHNRLP